MLKRNPTILDVAQAANVSTATVSRVLNGGKASPAARSSVEAAVLSLGYRRNVLARGLVTGKTGVVGVLIPDIAGPLYAQMARGIEDVLEARGMHYMLITGNRNAQQESEAIELLLERQVDALILIGSGLEREPLEVLLRHGPPTVLMEREGNPERFTTISLDNSGGAKAATTFLIQQGHRRVAHITGIRRAGERRLEGYLTAMREARLEPGPIIQGDFSEEGGRRAAKSLLHHVLHEGVSAVFCANDRMALGLYHLFKSQKKRIPKDLSVIGFDDLPWGAYLDPPLSTVRQPARAMGRAAAAQALAVLDGKRTEPDTRIAAELVVRASVTARKGGAPAY